ncbi:hypothetical protein HRJ34_17910 [Rhizorhabdus wittichii]|uniref:Uncharacterized protein n=1 Tax=Rhizorhabdus wittichii TaxID=160791 RepID=A0A975HCG0_9SPHN|nr:hypothetical protein [Rhizorhabdus wittichii]QTH20217.1 hypothetical protein HRJ34_17910 [Rhizorhabdus wittichii]
MGTEDDSELVRRLFALLTMKLEDAATEAVEGQGANQQLTFHIARAENVAALCREAQALAETIVTIANAIGGLSR